MIPQTWWYLCRASGMVAWVISGLACLWGILLITRMLKPADRPAWLLDLHRWLGILSVAVTAVHLLTWKASGDPDFPVTWKDLFIPFAHEWQAWAISWGIFAFYLLVAVQISSYLMKKIPKRLWHAIHLSSYVMFVMATIHGVQVGTDSSNILFVVFASGGFAIVAFASVARFLQARHKRLTRAEKDKLLADATS
ncbi:MAG: ferric reductase-like transmembrane domain-containing protein [Actinomycetota bacterium]